MNLKSFAFCSLALILPWTPDSALARSVVDVTGSTVQLNDSPRRIVTLIPSLGELAAELVGSQLDRIVGVSEYSDEPPGLKNVASIGPYTRFNLEKVLALKPDLVLGSLDGNSKDQILHLRELGIPVVLIRTESFSDIEESIRLVSESIGEARKGQAMVQRIKTGISKFKEKSKQHAPLKVLLQVGDQPLVVVGGKSFLHAALELVGAQNIYGDSDSHYPRPSVEDLIKKDPDVIVILVLGSDPAPFEAMQRRWSQISRLKAVRSKKVYLLRSDELLRPTVRILEGILKLEKVLYGSQ